MRETLRLENELVLILPGLYLDSADVARMPPTGLALRGLARMARFGATERLPGGWRAWLAAALGRADLAAASPAAIAATTVSAWPDADRAGGQTDAGRHLWLADPVHLIAGLTSVHLAPQGILSLDTASQLELRETFDHTFAELGWRLAPLRGGGFLARGPAPRGEALTTEPARALGMSLAASLPRGPGAAALLALGAEMEMWLHEHPLNARRQREGLAPISTLWLWGGGPPVGAVEAADRVAGPPRGTSQPEAGSLATAVFSDDAYVEGLAHLCEARVAPSARDLPAVLAARAPRRVVTLELVGPPTAALEQLDRDWIVPALGRLQRREIARLSLIANDRRLSLGARDLWKRWRRPRTGWEALQ
jgi:hypothetical protein